MAFPCLSMVLDPQGKVLISNNIETFSLYVMAVITASLDLNT